MATNIIEAIQRKLENPSLHKVDPNIQEVKEKPLQAVSEKLAQAAIPAVLTGYYKLTRTEEGCQTLISWTDGKGWLDAVFAGQEDAAVEKVAHYASVSNDESRGYMETIANEALPLIKEAAGNPPTTEKVKTYMNGQRHNILVYLPADLNMGDLLDDKGLDDRTNKMEGPISTFMHRIEDNMSGAQ